MIDGFVQIDRHAFYGEVWPRIEKQIEAIHSNLKRHKERGTLPLVIYWGHKGEIRDENTIVAVSYSDGHHPDEYWISPDLLAQ